MFTYPTTLDELAEIVGTHFQKLKQAGISDELNQELTSHLYVELLSAVFDGATERENDAMPTTETNG